MQLIRNFAIALTIVFVFVSPVFSNINADPNPNEAPAFDDDTRISYQVLEGENLNFQVAAVDPDGTTPTLTGELLPPNATFVDNGDGTGTFDFTPDIGTEGTIYNVRLIASDGSLADTITVRVSVVIDTDVRDTLRLELPGDWVITTPDDSSYSVEVWAWTDDTIITGLTIPLRLTMSGPHYTPEKFDSLVVVDKFVKDAGFNPMTINFRRSVLKNDVSYPASDTDEDYGFVGAVVSPLNIGTSTVLNIGSPTLMGELILKIRHPDQLPQNFTIEIDSVIYPPFSTLKFSPLDRFGFPPYFQKVTIPVSNVPLDAEEDLGEIKPESYRLNQNTPNPFNPSTTISFYNEAKGHVNLAIYNLLGQRVKTLIDWEMASGPQDVLWDGTDNSGENVSSGIYFYRLSAGDFHDIKKMMLLK